MFGTLQKALALGHKLQASAQIVLARTLRKYEEKWVTEFQRQASGRLPSLADVWSTEKKEPSVGALSIQQPGQSDISPADSSAAKIADLERKKKAAEKKAAAAEKKLAALTDDEGDGEAGPNADRNKRKKAARKAKAKEKAEAEAAAAATATPGTGK